MEQEDSSKVWHLRRALARRLANGSTAFEAAPLIKPPALRGVSDLVVIYLTNPEAESRLNRFSAFIVETNRPGF